MFKQPSGFLWTPPIPLVLPCLVQARLNASWLLKTKTAQQQAPGAEHEGRGFQKHLHQAAGGVNGSAPTDFKGSSDGLLFKKKKKKKIPRKNHAIVKTKCRL